METSVDKLLVTVRGSSGAVKIIADNEPEKAPRTFTKKTHTHTHTAALSLVG